MGEQHTRRRFPRWVYDHGIEPDPRFSLANERTFLAWIRTALALLAIAVALVALDVPAERAWRLSAAGLFALASVGSTVWAWIVWATTERQLRSGRALPGLNLGGVVGAVVVLAVVVIVIGVVEYEIGIR